MYSKMEAETHHIRSYMGLIPQGTTWEFGG